MTKNYTVTGTAPAFFVECDGVNVGGPYTVRTNATRRIRLLKESDLKETEIARERYGRPVFDSLPVTFEESPVGAAITAPVVNRHCVGVYPAVPKRDYRMTPARTY